MVSTNIERNKQMTFTLEDNEAAFIIRVLGQLPTETGAYPLHVKLVEQFNTQQQQPTENNETVA